MFSVLRNATLAVDGCELIQVMVNRVAFLSRLGTLEAEKARAYMPDFVK